VNIVLLIFAQLNVLVKKTLLGVFWLCFILIPRLKCLRRSLEPFKSHLLFLNVLFASFVHFVQDGQGIYCLVKSSLSFPVNSILVLFRGAVIF